MNPVAPLSALKNKLLAEFKDFEAGWNGTANGSIADTRRRAIDTFDTLGFPTVKNEEWKYTNISKFIDEEWGGKALETSIKPDFSRVPSFLDIESHRLVFCDGRFRYDMSLIKEGDEALDILPLSEALKSHKDTISQHFGKAVPAEVNGLTALNTAFGAEGAYIHVKQGVKPKYPVHVLYLGGGKNASMLNQLRNMIIVEASASLELIETYASEGHNEYLLNTVSEVFAAENAILNQYRFQIEDRQNARQVNFTGMVLQKNSLVNNFTITTGGRLVRNDLQYRLDGEHCESHMFGLYISSENQHIDNHTLVDHASPNCFSNEFYKGVIADKSTAVFNGKIIVRPHAQKTNAYQSNKNILLSDEAHINTKPQLEIFANDVKCSHGATTGQLDDEALFYLRSRGIGTAEAKAMLTAAFAADVLENIKSETVKEYAVNLVMQQLSALKTEK